MGLIFSQPSGYGGYGRPSKESIARDLQRNKNHLQLAQGLLLKLQRGQIPTNSELGPLNFDTEGYCHARGSRCCESKCVSQAELKRLYTTFLRDRVEYLTTSIREKNTKLKKSTSHIPRKTRRSTRSRSTPRRSTRRK